MAITDELRKWAAQELAGWKARKDVRFIAFSSIADRIDAAHRSALEKLAAQLDETSDMREFCGRLEEAATNREDVTLWDVDYVPLPLDADGVSIHVGDKLTDGEYRFTVHELATFKDGSWSIRNEDGNAWAACDVTHRTPTVEDVLREMLSKYDELRLGPRAFDPFELMAEYAAKLRELGIEANK